jgi:hypothetical protein
VAFCQHPTVGSRALLACDTAQGRADFARKSIQKLAMGNIVRIDASLPRRFFYTATIVKSVEEAFCLLRRDIKRPCYGITQRLVVSHWEAAIPKQLLNAFDYLRGYHPLGLRSVA